MSDSTRRYERYAQDSLASLSATGVRYDAFYQLDDHAPVTRVTVGVGHGG